VTEVLKTTPIGYISVTSKKGEIYSYPVAFHYADQKIYMMTPIGSAKMKFIKANPNISFIVDNKLLAKKACGAMFQGKAKIFGMVKLITSIFSLGPKMASFAKKYPGMFTFYARGKELPDERKLYKYRIIRIDPTKIVYWIGYAFGKYVPQNSKSRDVSTELDLKDESKMNGIAGLIDSADEELEMDKLPVDADWLGELKEATSSGLVSQEEGRMLSALKISPNEISNAPPKGRISSEEKDFLKKWKTSSKKEG